MSVHEEVLLSPEELAESPTLRETELGEILRTAQIRCVYQPIVELASRDVVGYEALARGPKGSELERPDLLFGAARHERRLIELDDACRRSAIAGATAAGLPAPWTLFINTEPETAEHALSGDRALLPSELPSGARILVEITERALTANPIQLLQLVGRVRELGWGVALDDVGAERGSLALLPLLQPDVIKLDLRLVQDRPSSDIAEIVGAVNAEAERSGTILLAEGIETEAHLQTALSLGATLGQGWLFGRPGELPAQHGEFVGTPIRINSRDSVLDSRTPFELAAQLRAVKSAKKPLLIEISKHLEHQAMRSGDATVVLATFQDATFFTPATRRRYADLAQSAALVGALGEHMPHHPMPGVRGGLLSADDPIIGEWDIAVVGPHFAATLVARDLGDSGPDSQRRFEFVLSHDRDLAIAVAASLASRIWPEPAHESDLPVPAGLTVATGSSSATVTARPELEQVTDQNTVLQALNREHPGLLARALSATRTGITIADARQPNFPLVYVNEAFSRITGYPVADCLGRNCRFLQGAATDHAAVAEMGTALRNGQPWTTMVRNYRKNGAPWWNQLELSPVRADDGTVTHYIGIQDDVTARVEAEERVAYLAYHDQLTGLATRESLAEHLRLALERGERHNLATALLFIDLDRFKEVNDRFGHAVGDQVLREISTALRAELRATDVLARQGGDEFLLLLSDLQPASAQTVASRVAEQLHDRLHGSIRTAAGAALDLAASIGISIAPEDGATADELLQHADAAMYVAKRLGRDQHQRWHAAG